MSVSKRFSTILSAWAGFFSWMKQMSYWKHDHTKTYDVMLSYLVRYLALSLIFIYLEDGTGP